ncbi:hypothetical protein [Rhizobium leguminosarum]|uniref:hypothetical protein n=1 Tax=Rhizobium leguminosarum TaxID=384 RepID=UPI00123714D7|nr:hypothetical protein [Rhizobium leguminosarum]
MKLELPFPHTEPELTLYYLLPEGIPSLDNPPIHPAFTAGVGRPVYTGVGAFDEFLKSWEHRLPAEQGQVLALFCVSHRVYFEGRVCHPIENRQNFIRSVLTKCPDAVTDRPVEWIEQELEAIVDLMVRHGA